MRAPAQHTKSARKVQADDVEPKAKPVEKTTRDADDVNAEFDEKVKAAYAVHGKNIAEIEEDRAKALGDL